MTLTNASRWTSLVSLGRTILIAGGAIAAYVAVALLASALTGDAIAGSAIANVAAFVFAIVYRWHATGSPLAPAPEARARTFDFWFYAAAALIVFWIAGQAAAVWVYETWGSAAFDSVSAAKGDTPVWLLLVASLVLAPVGEESLIRGIAYPELRKHWSPLAAAFVTALVFALLHGNLVQIVLTIPLGVLLALVYEACRRLWPVIIMHVTFNLASTFVPKGVIEQISTPLFVVPFAALGVVIVYFGMGQRSGRRLAR